MAPDMHRSLSDTPFVLLTPITGKLQVIYGRSTSQTTALQTAFHYLVYMYEFGGNALLAKTVILQKLKKDVLFCRNVEDVLKVRVGVVFMPHGLRHFIGCDAHNVSGYPEVRM